MTLSPGEKLGPYQISAPVGSGGMGEVYRARDTRLDRTVAIKVMNAALSALHEMSLEHEARAVAALNHPHICALHDVSRQGNTPFLVMEYVEGETLAARLVRGPLPIREAVRCAIQIAEALDHAHRHGVVHRDLKPANIMLTKSGVKILDFGLATLRAAAPLEMPMERTPSVQRQVTSSEQTVLGTVHYLSPERLEGQDAQAAADIFAFGAVTFEMVTGRRAFESNTPAGVIAAIMQAEPPAASTIRADVPAALDWVIQKALAKNPDNRWQAAGDIVEVLRWIVRGDQPGTAARPDRRVLPLAVAGLVLAAAGGYLTFSAWRARGSSAPAMPSLTFSIAPPASGGFTPTPSSVQSPQFSLSPNGRRLVFVASIAHEPQQLWVRELDSLHAEPVAGTNGAEYPFWSPDSASIGFFANGTLKRIDLIGGPARVLAPAPHGRGGAWAPTGVILFTPNTQSGLFQVPAAGGPSAPVSVIDASMHASHRWPQFLPDSRHFLYFAQGTTPEGHAIYRGDLANAEATRRLRSAPLSAAFVPPDHLLFVVDDALMASKFDWREARLIGEPFQIVSPVAGSSNFFAAFSASETGLLVYASSAASSELIWMGRKGERLAAAAAPAQYADFRLSPDDRQLAIAEVDPQTRRPDIRVLDLGRGTKHRITYDAATDASPIWSDDGQHVVFRSNRGGLHDLYRRAANGAGQSTLLFQSKNAKYPTDWMPDGSGIIYHTYEGTKGANIWMMKPDGSQPKPIVDTPFDDVQGQVSSDGKWLAYTSVETGQPEVYIRSLADANVRWQISSSGGTDPRWRSDGRELFYISAASKLTSVDFSARAPSAPRPLFDVKVLPAGMPYLSNYDVASDGQRFLVKVPVHDMMSAPIHVLTNWLR